MFLFGILLAAGFFGFTSAGHADNTNHLFISEVMVGGSTADEEFVELFNPTSADIDLAALPLKLHIINSTGATDTNKTLHFTQSIIKAHGYFLIASSVYQAKYNDEITADATYSAALVSDGAVYISTSATKNVSLIDLACWGSSQKCDSPPANPEKEYSLEKNSVSAWQQSYLKGGTPGTENFTGADQAPPPPPPPPPPIEYSEQMFMTELFPAPSSENSTKEFVEFYNADTEMVDLAGWRLKDANLEKSIETDKSCIMPKFEIKPGDYKAFYLAECAKNSISLNNGGDELNLYNPRDAALVSSASYTETAKPDYSWSLRPASNDWQWTSKYTPDGENIFDDPVPPPPPIEYSDQLMIDELFPHPSVGNEEFVELYNAGDNEESLDGWKLKDKGGNTCNISDKKIAPDRYLAIKKSDFSSGCAMALNDTGGETVSLYNPRDTSPVSVAEYTEDAQVDYSWSFDPDSGDWQWTKDATPDAKNEFPVETPPVEDEPGDTNTPPPANDTPSEHKVYLNEILPNPKGTDTGKEFVEIYNAEDEQIDLTGWTLKYASSTYHFPDGTKIDPGKYLAILNGTDFKFSLGNSGERTLALFDKDDKKASAVSWSGAKEAVSYNFDGAFWHWSRKLTPGEENKFNHAPQIKIEKIKDTYVGMPLTFSLSAKDKDKDKLKFVWDFGDGHKSYMKNPTHIFLKKKNYHVILTVDDGSDKFAKTLTVKVKKYPKQNVKMIQLNPNPAGNDTGKEKITLINNSKKKINLKGWKIATGTSSKKLINHIIAADFFIPAGKPADLTHLDAFFYLNNKAMKLELRYPDGQTADKLAYAKDKIADDEIYKKTGNQWAWIAPPAKTELAVAPTPAEASPTVVATETEVSENLGKFTANPELEKKNEYRISLANYDSKIVIPKDTSEPSGRVLGASTVRETESTFSFTQAAPPEKHWLMKFLDYLAISANALANKLFLRFN